MDLAQILASLGINPATVQGLGQDAAGIGSNIAKEASTLMQPAPNTMAPPRVPTPGQPIMLGPGSPSGRAPLPFGTEPGNTMTGLPAAPAANAPLTEIPLANDRAWPPRGGESGGVPESGMMKQAMLMIQAALDPDTVAAKADAAGIPAPNVGAGRTGRGQDDSSWNPFGLSLPDSTYGRGGAREGSAAALPPTNIDMSAISAALPSAPLGTNPAGSLPPVSVDLPGTVGALPEAGVAAVPVIPPKAPAMEAAAAAPPIIPAGVPASPASLGYEGTNTPAPAASALQANLKKALTGVKAPDGSGGSRQPGSSGVVAPKDFDSVAAFLAQVMSGQAAPKPAKLPFL